MFSNNKELTRVLTDPSANVSSDDLLTAGPFHLIELLSFISFVN